MADNINIDARLNDIFNSVQKELNESMKRFSSTLNQSASANKTGTKESKIFVDQLNKINKEFLPGFKKAIDNGDLKAAMGIFRPFTNQMQSLARSLNDIAPTEVKILRATAQIQNAFAKETTSIKGVEKAKVQREMSVNQGETALKKIQENKSAKHQKSLDTRAEVRQRERSSIRVEREKHENRIEKDNSAFAKREYSKQMTNFMRIANRNVTQGNPEAIRKAKAELRSFMGLDGGRPTKAWKGMNAEQQASLKRNMTILNMSEELAEEVKKGTKKGLSNGFKTLGSIAAGVLGGNLVQNATSIAGRIGMIRGINPMATGYQWGQMTQGIMNRRQEYVSGALADAGNVLSTAGAAAVVAPGAGTALGVAAMGVGYGLNALGTFLKYRTAQQAQQASPIMDTFMKMKSIEQANQAAYNAMFRTADKEMRTLGMMNMETVLTGRELMNASYNTAIAQAIGRGSPGSYNAVNSKQLRDIAIANRMSPAQLGEFTYGQEVMKRYGGLNTSLISRSASAYGVLPTEMQVPAMVARMGGMTETQAAHTAGGFSQMNQYGRGNFMNLYNGGLGNAALRSFAYKQIFGENLQETLSQAYSGSALESRKRLSGAINTGNIDANIAMDMIREGYIGNLMGIGNEPVSRANIPEKEIKPSEAAEKALAASYKQAEENSISVGKAFEYLTGVVQAATENLSEMNNEQARARFFGNIRNTGLGPLK